MSKSTIYDVAKLANVSTATVSRFLNKNSHIEKEKVRAIEDAIFQLNYRPRKRRKGHRSMSIGVLMPSLNDAFSLEILDGIRSMASQYNYQMVIEPYNWDKNTEISMLIDFKKRKLDSVIIVVGCSSFVEVKSILEDTPTLFVCRKENDIYPVLWGDNIIGGSIATNHLLQLGHREIAHLSGSDNSFDSIDRKTGFLKSFERAGLPVNPNLIVDGGLSLEGGFEATNRLLNKGLRFSAIFAANDLSAFGAIQALHRHKIRVPEDVSVIGFDDHKICDYFIPRLTTIKQPLFNIGQLAYQSILDIMCGEPSDVSIPPFEVIIRESTLKLT